MIVVGLKLGFTQDGWLSESVSTNHGSGGGNKTLSPTLPETNVSRT